MGHIIPPPPPRWTEPDPSISPPRGVPIEPEASRKQIAAEILALVLMIGGIMAAFALLILGTEP